MSRIDDLIEEEGRAAEEYEATHPDAPIPEGTTITRGHNRTRTLQVRVNAEELEALETLAEAKQLPVSTMVRIMILDHLQGDESPAAVIANMEQELAILRRKLSA